MSEAPIHPLICVLPDAQAPSAGVAGPVPDSAALPFNGYPDKQQVAFRLSAGKRASVGRPWPAVFPELLIKLWDDGYGNFVFRTIREVRDERANG
jgi:hypothetical protein